MHFGVGNVPFPFLSSSQSIGLDTPVVGVVLGCHFANLCAPPWTTTRSAAPYDGKDTLTGKSQETLQKRRKADMCSPCEKQRSCCVTPKEEKMSDEICETDES